MGRNLSTKLIIAIASISFFGFIIDKIGIVWIGIAAGGLIALYLFYKSDKNKLPIYPIDEFGPIFPNPKSASNYYRQLMYKDSKASMRLRNQDIIRESLKTALRTKKIDIAEANIKVAQDTYEELTASFRPEPEKSILDIKYKELLNQYHTQKYLNQIDVCIDKIMTLKTQKTKDKYLDTAKDYIKNSRNNPMVDLEKISEIEMRLIKIYNLYKI